MKNKKTLLLVIAILIILVTTVSLGACASAAPFQKIITDSSPWVANQIYTETLVYDVENGDEKGTYTTTMNRYDGQTIKLKYSDTTIENFVGYYFISKLVVNEKTIIETETTTSKSLITSNAIKITYGEDGKYTKESATYTEKKYNLTTVEYTADNKEVSNTTATYSHKEFAKVAYFDNSIIYYVARFLQNSTTASLSAVIPSVKLKDFDTVSFTKNATKTTVSTLINDKAADLECTSMVINTTRNFPGKYDSITCYFVESIDAYNAPIVKFSEGNVTYKLRSIK